MRTIPATLLIASTLLGAGAALAAALPKDGGEPAKAYRACLASIDKKDKPAVIANCFAKDDAWLAKTNLDYFTPETFAVEVRQLRRDFRLVEVKIEGGEVQGTHATLRVSGQCTTPRIESTGDIVEAGSFPVKGTVTMSRTPQGWRPTDSDLQQFVP